MLKQLTLALTLLAALSTFGQAATKTVTLSWDHDGLITDGYLLSARQATNQPFVPMVSIPPTNRTATVTLTNIAFIQFVVQATNRYAPSDLSNILDLRQPAGATGLRVVAIVTVQTP